jgi:hypothetical protein
MWWDIATHPTAWLPLWQIVWIVTMETTATGTVNQTEICVIDVLWNFTPCSIICVEIMLHGSKFQKTSIIETAVKVYQKTAFYEL